MAIINRMAGGTTADLINATEAISIYRLQGSIMGLTQLKKHLLKNGIV